MAKRRTLIWTEADRSELCRLYFDENLTLKQIGERFGCGHGSVRHQLLAMNIDLRERGRPKEQILNDDQVFIAIQAYREWKWSLDRIASVMHVYHAQVRTVLIDNGVEMRKHLGGERHDVDAIREVNDAIRRGDLRRGNCEQCQAPAWKQGKVNVIAHHDDYNFPLVVRWLCHRCHRAWHQQNMAVEKK